MPAQNQFEITPTLKAVQGTHLIADLQGCRCRMDLLCDADLLAQWLREAVGAVGLSMVGETFHKFSGSADQPGGVTGVVLLAESHVAVHTWPEFAVVTLDVYVCNYAADNSVRAACLMDALVAAFAPEQWSRQTVMRSRPGRLG